MQQKKIRMCVEIPTTPVSHQSHCVHGLLQCICQREIFFMGRRCALTPRNAEVQRIVDHFIEQIACIRRINGSIHSTPFPSISFLHTAKGGRLVRSFGEIIREEKCVRIDCCPESTPLASPYTLRSHGKRRGQWRKNGRKMAILWIFEFQIVATETRSGP